MSAPTVNLQPCGTYGGYQSHHRVGTEPCDECRQAAADYAREYRQRTGSRVDRRHSYASTHALENLKRLHPGQYRVLYEQYASEWEAGRP